MNPHIIIEAVHPTVDGGRFPIKRVVGDRCTVEADVLRDGHEHILVALVLRKRGGVELGRASMMHLGNDRWRGTIEVTENARYELLIEAWTDPFGTWVEELGKKVKAGVDVQSELLEGAALIDRARKAATGSLAGRLEDWLVELRGAMKNPEQALEIASTERLHADVAEAAPRDDLTVSEPFAVVVDPAIAKFGSWYEMFPRSQGIVPGKASTLREAEQRLPAIRDMGFDVLYLPPIHPIGKTHRKGRNNSLKSADGDPGCPWAIGSEAGGHKAVEPSLGTLDDFDHFVAAAKGHGLHVALDFAIQCSPDHPWVKLYPQWFYKRPDGTIKYAENPPKKYEDVYPINFDTHDREALWQELCDVVLFWVNHGVRIFRVDNPHTKPLAFWDWLIERVQRDHPDVVFLAEAFTRPKLMKALAKRGFTQSYTYFTWRNHKQEIIDYVGELAYSGMQEYYRPNFFANTPDILPEVLQKGGRPAFKMRAVLAATLSPTYGIYSGFELCENEALPGREEYKNSEKYEIKVRDWDLPGSIAPFISRLNAIRKGNPALQDLSNVHFLHADNEQILFYGKRTGDNVLLVAVNLDPFHAQACTVWVPSDLVGVAQGGHYRVSDLLTGAAYEWGQSNYVRLDPHDEPAHILRVERF